MKNRGIALRLILLILSSIAVIFSIVLFYNYFFSRMIISENLEKNARNLAQSTVNRIDSVLMSVEKVPRSLAYFYEDLTQEGEDLTDLLRSVVKNNPEIYGTTIAFEPYKFNSELSRFSPYVYRDQDKIVTTSIPYDYIYHDWYQIPKELNKPSWTEPYFDEGAGNVLMVTYSMPFYRNIEGKRIFMGVVTADISLDWLQEIVSGIKIGQTGYGFLLSTNGTFVTHPDQKLIMNETIFSIAEAMGDEGVRELGRKMISRNSGFTPFVSITTGKDCWMAYTPLPSNGWSLAVLFPKDELMADISRLSSTLFLISLGGFIVILLATIWIARSITGPLRALSKAAEDIAKNGLDVEIPLIKSRDEVGKLADSFLYMKNSLKKYILDLTEATAERERMESDLKIAHNIQMGILPKNFPAFPDRSEFDIYASLVPAREVGGDLYDFFLMDEDHLCFTVGDVSGKGIPAAIFMAITKTLIKSKATQGLTSERIMKGVNEDLSIDNPSLMFVTLFLGILDLNTGELEYCNAGHNPPYLINASGRIEPLPTTNGMALGVMEEFVYRSNKIQIHKGDRLFIFTDGVTETFSRDGDLFSEKRLTDALENTNENSLAEITDNMINRVTVFSQGLPQADDITIMILKYYGKTYSMEKLPNDKALDTQEH